MPERRLAAPRPSPRTGGEPDLPAMLRRTCAADPMAVRSALIDITAAVGLAGAGLPVAGALELVLAEVLNNIVEHAYAGMAPGVIDIEVVVRHGDISCRVRDGGRPMPGGGLPAGHPPAAGCGADLPEGGFGWFLIGMLARDIAYRRDGGSNELRFRVGPVPAAP